jgi:hypothetical protein
MLVASGINKFEAKAKFNQPDLYLVSYQKIHTSDLHFTGTLPV